MAQVIDGIVQETPAQRWKRRIKKTLLHVLYVAVFYALLVVAARALHRRVLYQPPAEEPAKLPDGTTLLTTRAADGAVVNAIELLSPKATRTVVHFHGNAETAEDNASLARDLVKRGLSVVLVEYRGYGRSRSTPASPSPPPTEEGLYADAAAVLDALAARGTGPDRVVLWGQALGAGVAVEMAARGRGTRMVLVAPFTSTTDLARRVAPFLPLSYVMVDRFDNAAKAPGVTTPTLVIHGNIDDVIPFEQGQRLSGAFPHATLLEIREGKHENLYKNGAVIASAATHAGG